MTESARILIIDDDESIRKTICMKLQHAGYQVDTAGNGKQAVEMTDTKFYNLAVIDIRLPDMDGIRLLTSLKETTPKMVKIILTGYPLLENVVSAVNKGADAYLIKPVNTDELLKVIREHLNKQKQDKEYGQEKIAEYLETRLGEVNENQSVDRE